MRIVGIALACLAVAQASAQLVVRVPATARIAPGLGVAPSAMVSALPALSAPALTALPLAASLPLFAAPGPSAAAALPAAEAFDGSAARAAADVGTPGDDARLQQIKSELRAYGQEHGIRGLEGRVLRGLDPAGSLAVEETRAKLKIVAERLGASLEEVVAFTNELHVGGIWRNADLLKDATAPKVKVWIIAGGATAGGTPVKDGDLTPAEFKADLEHVNHELDSAVAEPESYFQASRAQLIARSETEYAVKSGVPVSGVGNGFLAMAVNGYMSGIVVDTAGKLPFVGAERLDYAALMKKHGLTRISREDRGRIAHFYVDSAGREIVKEVYPGLAIVLNGDMALARDMARDAAKISSRTPGA